MTDGRRFLWTALFAAWVLAFAYAFISYWTTAPEGGSFLRGANRIVTYLGWQGAAGMLAVAIFGVGRAWPKGVGARRLSAVPLVLALLHVAAIMGIIAWARFAS